MDRQNVCEVRTQTIKQFYPHHPFQFSSHKHHHTSLRLIPTFYIYLNLKSIILLDEV